MHALNYEKWFILLFPLCKVLANISHAGMTVHDLKFVLDNKYYKAEETPKVKVTNILY